MRRLILAIMIVLLPLRGLAGDVMAVEMASIPVDINTVAASAHKMGATGSFDHKNQSLKDASAVPDCHEQVAASAGTDDTTSSDDSSHCQSCQSCQVCHSVALSPSLAELTASFASPQLRPSRVAAFTSATAALGQKPPIS